MKTRAEREQLIKFHAAQSIRSICQEPQLSYFLDELERAESEGLTHLVKNILSQIVNHGTPGGFELELRIANIAMDLPHPRTIKCEQQEGLCESPGDIWIDMAGIRYEFQCKYSENWTVDMHVRDAHNYIAKHTSDRLPGYLFDFTPSAFGSRDDWKQFAKWVVSDYLRWDMHKVYSYEVNGRVLATISLFQERNVAGLTAGKSHFPGGVHYILTQDVQKKLKASFAKARKTISKGASPTQMNCLVVDYSISTLDAEDVSLALYGRDVDDLCTDPPTRYMDNSGLFYTGIDAFWSAVVFMKYDVGSRYSATATVFPHPAWRSEAEHAFESFPRTKVVFPTVVDLSDDIGNPEKSGDATNTLDR
jgi:hypothetical protein